MGKLIATIEKSRSRDVRVRFVEYQDRPYLDVRVFAVVDATGDRVPTRKGVALAVRKLPELIAALQQAEVEARKAGLIQSENDTETEAKAA